MKEINDIIKNANHILIIQADNPDGDSLSSSLALEEILENQNKKITLYCGTDIPSYLRYLSGWDRVTNVVPSSFDASIIVDSPNITLLESLQKNNQLPWIKSKPVIVLDHHQTKIDYGFKVVSYNPTAVSTTEVIYKLAKKNNWQLTSQAYEFIVAGILSDSLGLTTKEVTSDSVKIIAEAIENGVKLADLDNKRRLLQKKSQRILSYKGELLSRVRYELDGQLAIITIPWEEIEKYSYEYNPPMLVMDEMRQVEKVSIALAYKTYPDGRITAKLRSNSDAPYCAKIAEAFGGGGHRFASGFRIADGRKLEKLNVEVVKLIESLLK